MTIKLLTEHHLKYLSLKRGCTGSSESTLVKMPHCWKSHVAAHNWASAREKPVFKGGGANNNNIGADLPAHPRRLISAFVIRISESIMCKLNTGFLASICSGGDWIETRFKSETPKTGFLAARIISCICFLLFFSEIQLYCTYCWHLTLLFMH